MNTDYLSHFNEHQNVISALQQDSAIFHTIKSAAQATVTSLKSGGKLLVCGNGGSAADAQHLAAEFVVRLEGNRKALSAIALTTDTSAITACANDFDYSEIFARQIEAIGRPLDVFLGISTSGSSSNVVKAAQRARETGLIVIALTGASGGALASLADFPIKVPSRRTMRIQEGHILLLHIFADMVEQLLKTD
jgi:D-sedoheptulose 7-phosphate isomerase